MLYEQTLSFCFLPRRQLKDFDLILFYCPVLDQEQHKASTVLKTYLGFANIATFDKIKGLELVVFDGLKSFEYTDHKVATALLYCY